MTGKDLMSVILQGFRKKLDSTKLNSKLSVGVHAIATMTDCHKVVCDNRESPKFLIVTMTDCPKMVCDNRESPKFLIVTMTD